MTAGEALAETARRLQRAGIASPRLDARLLLAHVLGLEPLAVVARPERPLDELEAARLGELAARRERREPLAHITGRREFWSLSFEVTADTLDPRPDSETLVEAVLEALPDRKAPLRLLDLGTGTGCLLLALLSELPNARGLGVDVGEGACVVARGNLRRLGLEARAEIRHGDWGRGLDGPFDVIVANPPYIADDELAALDDEVARWEPRLALAAGPEGLDCYRGLAPEIARLLAPGGIAVLEVGEGRAAAVRRLLAASGLIPGGVRCDLAGIARCVIATAAG